MNVKTPFGDTRVTHNQVSPFGQSKLGFINKMYICRSRMLFHIKYAIRVYSSVVHTSIIMYVGVTVGC